MALSPPFEPFCRRRSAPPASSPGWPVRHAPAPSRDAHARAPRQNWRIACDGVSIGIPPIGHEHSRLLLIHDRSPRSDGDGGQPPPPNKIVSRKCGVWQTNPGRMHEIALQRRWMFIERGRTCYMTLSEWRLHQLQCCREGCSGGRMVHCKYIRARLAVSALMLPMCNRPSNVPDTPSEKPPGLRRPRRVETSWQPKWDVAHRQR